MTQRFLIITLLCFLMMGCKGVKRWWNARHYEEEGRREVAELRQDAQARYGELEQESRQEAERLRRDAQAGYQTMKDHYTSGELLQAIEARLAVQTNGAQTNFVFRLQANQLDAKAEAEFIQEVKRMARNSGATVKVLQSRNQHSGYYEFVITPKER